MKDYILNLLKQKGFDTQKKFADAVCSKTNRNLDASFLNRWLNGRQALSGSMQIAIKETLDLTNSEAQDFVFKIRIFNIYRGYNLPIGKRNESLSELLGASNYTFISESSIRTCLNEKYRKSFARLGQELDIEENENKIYKLVLDDEKSIHKYMTLTEVVDIYFRKIDVKGDHIYYENPTGELGPVMYRAELEKQPYIYWPVPVTVVMKLVDASDLNNANEFLSPSSYYAAGDYVGLFLYGQSLSFHSDKEIDKINIYYDKVREIIRFGKLEYIEIEPGSNQSLYESGVKMPSWVNHSYFKIYEHPNNDSSPEIRHEEEIMVLGKVKGHYRGPCLL